MGAPVSSNHRAVVTATRHENQVTEVIDPKAYALKRTGVARDDSGRLTGNRRPR
jgi:hypothetical protein